MIELDEAKWLNEWYVHTIWFFMAFASSVVVDVGCYYILVGIRYAIESFPYDACCLTDEEIEEYADFMKRNTFNPNFIEGEV